MPEIENSQKIITQEKWKSPLFWGTLATSLVGILSLFGIWKEIGVEEDLVLRIIGAVVAFASQVVGNWNDADVKNAWGIKEV